jgi:hypothetical protein
MRAISSCNTARVRASSAESGSSSSRILGSAHPLPHAAGEFVGFLVACGREIHHGNVLLDLLTALVGGPTGKHFIHGERDVVMDVQPREQRVILENDRAIRPGFGDRLAAQGDRAFIRSLQACDERHERRLARARVAHDGDELALGDAEIDVTQHVRAAGAEAVSLADLVEF